MAKFHLPGLTNCLINTFYAAHGRLQPIFFTLSASRRNVRAAEQNRLIAFLFSAPGDSLAFLLLAIFFLPMAARVKAVIFDLGGVLIPSPMEFWAKELEPSLGLEADSIGGCLRSADQLQALLGQLETGRISLEDFEPLFTQFYNKEHGTSHRHIPLFSGHRQWAAARTNGQWTEFVRLLRSEGFRTALLTNNFFADRARRVDTLPGVERDLFDVMVESCRVGKRKPEEAIFRETLDRLEIPAEQVLFVDDLGQNLKTARQLGMHTVKCSDTDQCLTEVRKLLHLEGKSLVPGTRRPSKEEEIPLGPLRKYFSSTQFGSGKSTDELEVRKFANGQSNPTYLVTLADGRQFVLRKKPPGSLSSPGAHRIEREFRVQRALRGVVPVPEMLDYVENLLPTPFYVMQFCGGRIFEDPKLGELCPAEKRQVWLQTCRVLAQIHAVDPRAVGLADFGKSGAYFRRNLIRMEAELRQSAGEMDDLLASRVLQWLLANCPQEKEEEGQHIVHGDFRLDNLIWSADGPMRVEAVLDWELSTLGDPLADLANLLLPFHLPSSSSLDAQLPMLKSVQPAGVDGIPSQLELLTIYLEAREQFGRPERRAKELLAPGSLLLRFAHVYALFRNAVILRGVHRRFRQGQASNAAMAQQLVRVPGQLLALAWAQIGRHGSTGKEVKADERGGFALSPEMMRATAFSLYTRVAQFIEEEILPKERQIAEWVEDEQTRWTVCPLIEQLKEKARVSGLWNLFITAHLDPIGQFGGKGLSTVEYAHICELMGRCLFAPEVFNCSAPDTGNMEVLIKYGNAEQQRRFLWPLLEGKTRSCFAMTEPDVASSDATNVQGTIARDGDHFLLNARKWFTSGAADPRCRLCVFMGCILLDSSASPSSLHRRHSIVLVPMPIDGLSVVRRLSLFGNNGDAPGGHCELLFHNVRVPVHNMILGEGRGFEIAQGRLGPGRIHHCMRLLGHGERALQLVKERLWQRRVGPEQSPLATKQCLRVELAESRIQLEQARLLVLKAAHWIDTRGSKGAAVEIAMIKVVAPRTVQQILDRAMQMFGAAGLTSDWPLASFFMWARALRLADGPDIVHLETVARRELQTAKL